MISRRLVPWTSLLAALALFAAQLLLTSHEIEHFDHPANGVCDNCLIGTGLGSPLISSPPAQLSDFTFAHKALAVVVRLAYGAGILTHRPRAPPRPDSTLRRFA